MSLITTQVPGPVVTHATGGYATGHIQRNWVARGMFSMPIQEPRAGEPRIFPLLAVYEAAILSWGAQLGVLPFVRDAWKWRRSDAAERDAGGAYVVSEHALADAARAVQLTEFLLSPNGDDLFWGLFLEPNCSEQMTASGGAVMGTWTQIGQAMFSKDREGSLILNVSALVRKVNRRLADAGYPVDASGDSARSPPANEPTSRRPSQRCQKD
jgi:hypothetical protein